MKTSPRLIAPLLLFLPTLAFAFDVTAKSAIVIDAGSGKVLWEKDSRRSMFPASTTKVMTALLLIERTRPEELITAPPEIKQVGESSMNLKPWEKVSAKDLLYGIMLRSANDGSYMAAKHIAGSVPAFAKLMNQRAKELGCTGTHFNNPNGLNDPKHVTSAQDLALITREAMKYPEFRAVVGTQKASITRSINKADTVMVNRNKLLKKDPSVEGVKTGYTRPAGYCFVGAATREDFRVITVVLNSQDWQADTQSLINEAYLQFDRRDDLAVGVPHGQVSLVNSGRAVSVGPRETWYTVTRSTDKQPLQTELLVREGLEAPVPRGTVIADMRVRDADGFEALIPMVALEDVPAMSLTQRAKSNPSYLFVGSMLCGGAFWMRTRVRRRSKPYARKTTSLAETGH